MVSINNIYVSSNRTLYENSNNEKQGITNSFESMLKNNLESINNKQLYSDKLTNDLVMGEDVEIHEVMIAQEEARMSLQLAVQIRNNLVECIQELTKMQI
ncbi:flagellar hook-basal body complex protein FliE [Clostridium sp.]|uniref:flagellar hook-basal body complex protein FliE n=1 Tax=Clostridium sp. TaxID=1506 RepID=UPI001B52FD8F|nr:flagellar hook-basal body complex protein FliE [Clostridium sp.]MBP3914469.1 flagellar hook-basal body complex protein FliE [Clostridium sp.]